MIHRFPYAEFEPLEIPESNLSGIYSLKEPEEKRNEQRIVREALDNPIGCGPLTHQLERGMRVVIAVDDASRTTKTELMLPLVLEELKEAGIPERDTEVFVALGTHRRMTSEELERKYTKEAVSRYRFINPDWRDQASYRSIGLSARSLPINLHRSILEADFVIGIGQAVPHLIAGFGGGGKIIVPGCADAQTIGEMHWLCTEAPEDRLYAVRDNAVRQLIDEAAEKAGLRFILNEVPGAQERIAGAFAGDPVSAHRAACAFAWELCSVNVQEQADIVVSDAYPADLDFWQAIKGLNAACRAVRRGGTVILVSPCPEGASAQHGELTQRGYLPIPEIERLVRTGELDKVVAANLYLGRRLLEKARVILVTRGISERDTKAMGFHWVPHPAEALKLAMDWHSRNCRINVLFKAAKMICRVFDADHPIAAA